MYVYIYILATSNIISYVPSTSLEVDSMELVSNDLSGEISIIKINFNYIHSYVFVYEHNKW